MNEIRFKLAAINEINQKTVNFGAKDFLWCSHVTNKKHTHQVVE